MKYVANRDLTWIKAGKKFTAADVPAGVSLDALVFGRLVQIATTATEKPADGEKGDN